jgi:hypothetical protein
MDQNALLACIPETDGAFPLKRHSPIGRHVPILLNASPPIAAHVDTNSGAEEISYRAVDGALPVEFQNQKHLPQSRLEIARSQVYRYLANGG